MAGAGIFVIILQAVVDVDNPECVIDGLLSHQAAEQRKGDTGVFADDIMVSLLIDIVEAGDSHYMYQFFFFFFCFRTILKKAKHFIMR